MNPKHIFLLLMAGMFHTAFAQTLSKEGTHEISKKANKGYLYEPKVDEANNEMTMTYVTKATGKFARFETYTFDLHFNFK